jgi:hypothetical protein
VLDAHPTAKLMDRTQYKQEQEKQIDQLLNLVYGLLGPALVIALIGIANTPALSIYERTREVGLLRAVGNKLDVLRAIATEVIGRRAAPRELHFDEPLPMRTRWCLWTGSSRATPRWPRPSCSF